MVIGSLGDVIFNVSRNQVKTFSNMQISGTAQWASHNRHLKSTLIEFTGNDLDKLTFTMLLSAFNGVNPTVEIAKLTSHKKSGRVLRLIVGGRHYGRFVIQSLSQSLERFDGSYEDGSVRAKRFIELVNRYTDFTELTIPMLNEFVNKIIVHERDTKGAIDSTQKVEIHLNFIGEYQPPMPEPLPLTPEQEEEQRLILQRREKYRQNYLKRKESGKQAEYDRRYKEKVKARKAAVKAQLLEDGVVLGASSVAPVPVSK